MWKIILAILIHDAIHKLFKTRKEKRTRIKPLKVPP